jgi:hypothetical protein
MLSYRLRSSAKPLRFILADAVTPLAALYFYLGMVAFYCLWVFAVVTHFGHGFLGVHARPVTLGVGALAAVALAHMLSQRRRLRGGPTGRLGLGLFFVLVAVGLFAGLLRGVFAQNIYLPQYQQGMVVLFVVTMGVAYAVPDQKVGARLVTVIAYFMTMMAFLELMSVVAKLMGAGEVNFQLIEFLYVAPFASIYWLVRYLTEHGKMVRSGFFLGVSILGVIARLQKPVVVPLFFALLLTGLILLVIFFVHPRLSSARILRRAVLLIVMMVAAVALLEVITPSSFLREYVLIFYDRFLKLNPETGVSQGRIDGGRLEYYGLAWSLISENRLFGLGLGAAFPHPELSGRYSFPHSLILDFLLSYGAFGVVVLFSSITLLTTYLLRNLKFAAYSIEKATLCGYLMYAFLVSLISYYWGHLPLVHVTAIGLGIALKLAMLDRGAANRLNRRRPGMI